MNHEDFSRKPPAHRLGDRRFGVTLSLPLAAAGLFPLLRGHPVRLWALGAGAALVVIALVYPRALAPLNWICARIAAAVAAALLWISSAILLYLVFAPIRFLFWLSGRDVLRLKKDATAATYWIPRNPPGPPGESMIRQF